MRTTGGQRGLRADLEPPSPDIRENGTSSAMTVKQPNIAIISAIVMIGTLGMHILVPALPDIAADLMVGASEIQLTISSYMLGLVFGQFFYGAISDRFGRRSVLQAGLILYIAGMALAVPATSLEFLLAARFLQAVGASAGLVLGRAMVQDGVGAGSAASRLSILAMAQTLSPTLAPLIGASIDSAFGWRYIFVALSLLGVVFTVACFAFLPETNRQPLKELKFRSMLGNYASLITSRRYLGYTIGGSSVTASLFIFLGGLPFLSATVSRNPAVYTATAYVVITGGTAAGAFSARLASRRFPTRTMALVGTGLCLLSAGIWLLIIMFDQLGSLTLVMPLVAYAIGSGLTSPNSLAGALTSRPGLYGSASSLYGVGQTAIGTIVTALPLLFGDYSAPTLAVLLVTVTLAGHLSLWSVPSRG
jgi:DHA1 family bicyclomycin/chloramphenicol resistance-like MFS transporter